MDPNYSVLLGDPTSSEICPSANSAKDTKKTKKIVEIVIPVVVGVVLLTAVFIFLYPRYNGREAKTASRERKRGKRKVLIFI